MSLLSLITNYWANLGFLLCIFCRVTEWCLVARECKIGVYTLYAHLIFLIYVTTKMWSPRVMIYGVIFYFTDWII